jgi:hypothetical protein
MFVVDNVVHTREQILTLRVLLVLLQGHRCAEL